MPASPELKRHLAVSKEASLNSSKKGKTEDFVVDRGIDRLSGQAHLEQAAGVGEDIGVIDAGDRPAEGIDRIPAGGAERKDHVVFNKGHPVGGGSIGGLPGAQLGGADRVADVGNPVQLHHPGIGDGASIKRAGRSEREHGITGVLGVRASDRIRGGIADLFGCAAGIAHVDQHPLAVGALEDVGLIYPVGFPGDRWRKDHTPSRIGPANIAGRSDHDVGPIGVEHVPNTTLLEQVGRAGKHYSRVDHISMPGPGARAGGGIGPDQGNRRSRVVCQGHPVMAGDGIVDDIFSQEARY